MSIGRVPRCVYWFACVLAWAGCAPGANQSLGSASEHLNGTATSPAILHDNSDGHEDISGVRMMRPEDLHEIILNTFGISITSIAWDYTSTSAQFQMSRGTVPYWTSLGGLDYTSVIERPNAPSAASVLVMYQVATEVCSKIVAAGPVLRIYGTGSACADAVASPGDYGQGTSNTACRDIPLDFDSVEDGVTSADTFARFVWSRALSDAESEDVRGYLEYLAESEDLTTRTLATARGVCSYFMLANGSFLLN